jgi:mycothiol synthase
MRVAITPLARIDLDAARDVLAAACIADRAAEVADEKLFAPAPGGEARAWGAHLDGALVGVAVTSAAYVRLLAVTPAARRRGVGSALLAHAEDVLRGDGVPKARAVSQPGNFLAPGIDDREVETIAWLARRGWVASSHRNVNLLVELRGNPRVSAAIAADAAARVAAAGYRLRRGTDEDAAALAGPVASEFGGSWPFEIARAAAASPSGLHVAERDGELAAFAVHDGNNQGLGWFGPAGTWPAHRSQGLGEALLLACLVDVAAHHAVCEVAWIGPRAFYERVAGTAGERRFVPMSKEL